MTKVLGLNSKFCSNSDNIGYNNKAMGLSGDYLSKQVKPLESAQSLTAEEGFLLSRMGAGISVKDLLPICPWPEDRVLSLLESLSQKNALQWMDSKAEEKSDNPLLAQLSHDEKDPELKNLDRDFRRDILMKLQTLDQKTPYEILDLPRNATGSDIKKNYLELSKKFHPDRFFRKKLGHYKEKLDVIFAKIQKAYATLKDPHQREVVDRMQSAAAATKAPRTKEQVMRSVRSLDPHMERLGKAEKYFQQGLESQKTQDYLTAYNSFALASQTNPNKENYKRSLEEVRPLMQRQKAQHKLTEAKRASEMRMTQEMMNAAAEALKLNPDLSEAQVLWAKGVIELHLPDDFRAAKERLLRAKAALPKNADASFLLGKLLWILGDTKAAKKELEETLKREPKHTGAKKLLEEI